MTDLDVSSIVEGLEELRTARMLRDTRHGDDLLERAISALQELSRDNDELHARFFAAMAHVPDDAICCDLQKSRDIFRRLAPHAKWLRIAGDEIAKAGHYGWGNTCADAADAIDAALGDPRD